MIDRFELFAARQTLGQAWGLNRALGCKELASVLGLGGRDPHKSIINMENGRSTISGPISRTIEAMLDGWRPADLDQHIARKQ